MSIPTKESLIEFCNTAITPGVEIRDQKNKFDKNLWRQAAHHSLHQLFTLEHKNFVDQFKYFETFSYYSLDRGLSFSIAAQLFSCTIPIYLFGNEVQKSKYLTPVHTGKFICCNAITEASSGSDVFSMQGSFIKSENKYQLQSQKKYITSAPVSNIALVYLKNKDSKKSIGAITAFILERKQNQYTCSKPYQKLGLKTASMSDIYIDAMVTDDQILNGDGAGYIIFQKSMIWERIGMSFMHSGISRKLLDDAKIFCKQRKSFRKSLSTHQSIYHKLAELETEWQASSALNELAAIQLEKKSQNILALASMCKYKSSVLLKQIAEYTLHLQGAAGHTQANDWERTYRDVAACDIYSGTSEMHKEIIASALNIKTNE